MENKTCDLNPSKINSQISRVNQHDLKLNQCVSTNCFNSRTISQIQKNTMNKNKYLPSKFHYVRSLNDSCLAQYFKQAIQKYVIKCRFFISRPLF